MYGESEPKICTIANTEIRDMITAKLASLASARAEIEAKLGDGVNTKTDLEHSEVIKESILSIDRRCNGLRFIRDHLDGDALIHLTANQLINLRDEFQPVSAGEYDIESRVRRRREMDLAVNMPVEASTARRW